MIEEYLPQAVAAIGGLAGLALLTALSQSWHNWMVRRYLREIKEELVWYKQDRV